MSSNVFSYLPCFYDKYSCYEASQNWKQCQVTEMMQIICHGIWPMLLSGYMKATQAIIATCHEIWKDLC